jgi:hypothetical protein
MDNINNINNNLIEESSNIIDYGNTCISFKQQFYNDMVKNEDSYEDDSDNLSEFIEFKDFDFDKNNNNNDELDSVLDFNFDFDIIFSPENNSEIQQITEIKSKIINKIKLNSLDLSYIKNANKEELIELIKIFNHMV